MFRKSTLFLLMTILSLALMAPAQAEPLSAATTVPGGDVSGNWGAAGSPYLIEGDIRVPAGATLTIEPGVEVLFQGWYSLNVNGTLIADGTENAPILFGGGHTTAGWLGVRFVNAADGSRVTHAIVENGRATGADPLNKGGGIYVDSSNPVISHSTIRNNQAKYSGGGIYLNNSNSTLVGNTIVNNTAGQNGGSANGGGVAIWYSNPIVADNNISGNSVSIAGSYTTPSGFGGGLFVRSSNSTFTGNLISDNHIDAHLNSNARGGGLYLYYGSPNFVSNTITGNSIENASSGVYAVKEGGGIYAYYSNAVFVNTILWNDAPQEFFVYRNSATFAYSDVQGGQAGIVTDNATINWEQGNINHDPRFVDAVAGDFSLSSNSQLIDAGTALFEWNGMTLVDLDPAEYNGSAPDMGAFEFGNGGAPNQPPVAIASVTPDHGSAPLTVQFSSADSYDPDGNISATSWDFGDGSDSNGANPSHTYTAVNTFQATLTVTDNNGATHSDTISINVQDGTTVYAGDVSGTWSAAGSPYRIEGDITIPAGQTLTIDAGTEISFQSWYGLTVNGTLMANGTTGEPILFTAVDSNPGWLGIRFVDVPDDSVLDHVIVEKGQASGASPYDSGGGIYIQNSSPTISNSTIRDNYAKARGGGIYLDSSNARLVGNTITNNQAGQGSSAYGGGIYMSYSNIELTDNVIRDNWVYIAGSYTTPSGLGGGIYATQSNPTLRGNLIHGNAVQGSNNRYARGGALYLSNSNPNLINNTITGNTVGTGGTYYIVLEGGGIYAYQSDPTIVNSILWNDTPQEIFVSSDSYVVSAITVAYSDVQGGQAGIVTNDSATVNWEQGNIDSDPRFTDVANADFTIQSNSPAVDAGTAYFEWNGSVLVDLSPAEYNSAAPDMGAFESTYSGGGSNQPPVAVASANPANGDVPLTVQFSSDGSYDPDGGIATFAWDFGDGNISSEADPAHTYTAAGTYNATLTVTDEDGATGNATVTIDVAQVSQNELHVQAQDVSRQQLSRRFWRGVDTILIADQNNQPVAGVNVTVAYSGPNEGQANGVTGSDGTVTLTTKRQRKPQGSWCFAVLSVAKDGYSYDPSANVATLQCE
jgi:parallel beta-helix repeat protein